MTLLSSGGLQTLTYHLKFPSKPVNFIVVWFLGKTFSYKYTLSVEAVFFSKTVQAVWVTI